MASRIIPRCHATLPSLLRCSGRLPASGRVGALKLIVPLERRWNSSPVKPNENGPTQKVAHSEAKASSPPRPTPLESGKAPLLSARLPKLAAIPKENIYTLPNILTFSRLAATPAIAYLILHDQHLAATALLAYAGLTDLVDGWIARRWNLQTVVGTVIDPLADKSLMFVLTIVLAVKGALPVWLATVILGRDASLAIAAIYYRFASLPPPKTLARYWDFSLPSAEVHPTGISKLNTALQLMLIGATTAMPLVGAESVLVPGWGPILVESAMHAAQMLVAGTTAWSGISYLYTRDAVSILRSEMSAEDKRRILSRGRGIIAVCFVACVGLAVVLER